MLASSYKPNQLPCRGWVSRRICFNLPTYHHWLSILTFQWDKNVSWNRSSWIILSIKYFCGCFDTNVQERTVSTNYSVLPSLIMLTCFSCVSFNADSQQSGYLCLSKPFCTSNTLTLSLLKYTQELLSLHTKTYIFIKVNLPFCSICLITWKLAFSFSHSSIFIAYISQTAMGASSLLPLAHTHTEKRQSLFKPLRKIPGTHKDMTGSQDFRPNNLDILPVIKQKGFEGNHFPPDVNFENNSGS